MFHNNYREFRKSDEFKKDEKIIRRNSSVGIKRSDLKEAPQSMTIIVKQDGSYSILRKNGKNY
ncbi:MAG: hypothetical protein HPY72_06960 [Anaerolineae bacterium]|nr:hypothetical protein [Anaerolineae bacterium]